MPTTLPPATMDGGYRDRDYKYLNHIFCEPCSNTLGLSGLASGHRICPACQSNLPNPDDAVSTSLNPTDDYKTSVLSGLTPSTIMDCAGLRGLTRGSVYQEYLAKTLTDKYGNLNVQVDKIINEANGELEILNQKITSIVDKILIGLVDMQMDQDRLKAENQSLAASLREKTRKHQQTQELYDRLKRKEMTAATRSAAQSAAFDSVDDVLGGVPHRSAYPGKPQGHRDFQPCPVDHNGVERVHTHQRSGSSHSHGSGGMMPPPPVPSPSRTGFHNNHFGFGRIEPCDHMQAVKIATANVAPTPSTHRTQLGPFAQPTTNTSSGGHHPAPTKILRTTSHNTPLQRQPLTNVNANSANKNSFSGYGMSAGAKFGRQQASRPGMPNQSAHGRGNEQANLPLPHPSPQPTQNANTYY
ncbi:MAG: hypothetical protein Q9163_003829 [Psora crenata]